MKLLNYLKIGAMAGALALTPKANAGGSIEVMPSSGSTTIDLKVSEDITPKTDVFIRNKSALESDDVSNFGLISFGYGSGVKLVSENQFIEGYGVDPRIGAKYFKKFGDFSVFTLGTTSLRDHGSFESVSEIDYSPLLSDSVKLNTFLETVINFNMGDYKFTILNPRLGLDVNGVKFGVGYDRFISGAKPVDRLGGYLIVSIGN
jgi:hypothetical protein